MGGDSLFRSLPLKIVRALLVMLLVTILTQYMLELIPGSPASVMLGDTATPEEVQELSREMGYDRPFFERYTDWIDDAVRGDLGRSPLSNRPVGSAIFQALLTTLELVVLASLFALGTAVLLALVAARSPGGIADRVTTAITSGALATPAFVAGPVLAYIFAVRLGWFPVTGWSPVTDGIGANLRSAILPAICIALPELAVYQRLLRADLVATLKENYIQSARALGLPKRRILLRYSMRPASIPLVTVAGISVGRLLGGTIVIETLFTIPGIGQLLASSVLNRDLVMVQGIVTVIALAYVAINLLIDVSYGIIDPRLRRSIRA
jgi:peptide/nickel transport system permease protein